MEPGQQTGRRRVVMKASERITHTHFSLSSVSACHHHSGGAVASA